MPNPSGFTGVINEPLQGQEDQISQITPAPVAGAGIASTTRGIRILFADRATGNIYEKLSDEAPRRITNTTIPSLQEAYFTSDGSYVVLRYLNGPTIESFLGSIPSLSAASTSEQELRGSFLENDMVALAASPTGASFYYLAERGEGTQGYSINPPAEAVRRASFAFKEWNIEWLGASALSFLTRPSSIFPGYFYSVDLSTGSLTRIAGDLVGLTAKMHPKGTHIIYSYIEGGGLVSYYRDLASGRRVQIVSTLPEKCVWSKKHVFILYCATPKGLPDADYPDAWYQGRISFNDAIWAYNVSTDALQLLVDLSEVTETGIDAVQLQLSSDDSSLIFKNKKDGSLWLYQLPSLEGLLSEPEN